VTFDDFDKIDPTQNAPELHRFAGRVEPSDPAQWTHETQQVFGGVNSEGIDTGHSANATHDVGAGVNAFPYDHEAWLTLRILGDTHNDLMTTRIGMSHRISRAAVNPDVLGGTLALMQAAEDEAWKQLRSTFRRVAPEVAAWVKDTPGLGERLVARLLGTIGHPIVAHPYRWLDVAPEGHECDPDRCGARHLVAFEPFLRSASQLRQFCGVGSPDRRTKGMSQEQALRLGNPRAKSLVHLVAEGTMKSAGGETKSGQVRRRSPYRDIYDDGRLRYEEREDWSKGRKHNASLRLVKKAFLLDLWLVAQGKAPLR
jgi:hypothetical protein